MSVGRRFLASFSSSILGLKAKLCVYFLNFYKLFKLEIKQIPLGKKQTNRFVAHAKTTKSINKSLFQTKRGRSNTFQSPHSQSKI